MQKTSKAVLDASESQRLQLLRFPLIVGVIFIHCYIANLEPVSIFQFPSWEYGIDSVVYNFISQGLSRVAVPLFFLMSGYFFFLNFEWSLAAYYKKLCSRFRTLFIPFLFWNAATLLFFLLAQSLPLASTFFNNHLTIFPFKVGVFLNTILGLTHSPIAYQFWFIRDLMVMVLLVPLIFFLLRRAALLTLGLLASLWFFNIWPIYIPSIATVFFFYLGTFLAFSKHSLLGLDKHGVKIICLYLIILVIDTITKSQEFNVYIHKIGILLGIVAALSATRFVLYSRRFTSFLTWASSRSFFVFAIHEPLLAVFRKFSYRFFLPSEPDMLTLLVYFILPVLVIGISFALYAALNAVTPRFLNVIIGGRISRNSAGENALQSKVEPLRL